MELGVTAVMLPELDFDEQVQLCVDLGVKYYQYRPRIIAEAQRDQPYTNWGNHKFDLTPDRFLKDGILLTKKLRAAGLEPWGAVFNCLVDMPDDLLKLFIEAASLSEANAIRCQPPQYPRGPFDYQDYLKTTIERYQYVVENISEPAGVKLLLETHQGSSVSGPGLTFAVLQHFTPDQMGAIFDMPNYAREGGVNEWLAVSVLKPWIDCVHMGGAEWVKSGRDMHGSQLWEAPFGPLEDSMINIPNWLKALKDSGINPPIIIEDYDQRLPGKERLIRCVDYLNRVIPTLG